MFTFCEAHYILYPFIHVKFCQNSLNQVIFADMKQKRKPQVCFLSQYFFYLFTNFVIILLLKMHTPFAALP